MKKVFFIAAIMALSTIVAMSQSHTEIIKNKIKSQTISEVDYENSNGKETLEQVEKYNQKGNLIEFIEYDSKGKVKKHEKYEYNENNEITKEVHIDGAGKVEKTIEYKYNPKSLKTEKITYDAANRKLKVKKYIYEYYQ